MLRRNERRERGTFQAFGDLDTHHATVRRGRVVAGAWVPKAGLTQEEFQLYVRAVAVESDRFEYRLTGRDNE